MSSILAQLLFEEEVSIASLDIKADADDDLFYNRGKLTSLAGAPEHISGSFSCNNNNKLTSLAGAPKRVGGSFSCSGNKLTSLVGAPKYVGGSFYCHGNKLTSLVGAPEHVGEDFYCDPGIALASIPLIHVGGKVNTSDDKLDAIINKYLNQGRRGCLALQQELIDAGYDVEAELIIAN